MSGMRRVRRRAFSFSPFPKKGKGVRRAVQKKQAKRQPPAGTPPKNSAENSPQRLTAGKSAVCKKQRRKSA